MSALAVRRSRHLINLGKWLKSRSSLPLSSFSLALSFLPLPLSLSLFGHLFLPPSSSSLQAPDPISASFCRKCRITFFCRSFLPPSSSLRRRHRLPSFIRCFSTVMHALRILPLTDEEEEWHCRIVQSGTAVLSMHLGHIYRALLRS